MFAIVDVETTGLSIKTERMTEIAIIIHDGQKVTQKYSTLINPEKSIPYKITQITGIDDSMVASAPKFIEVANKIIELTEGKILVGHNVRFDYNFLIREFKEFNYDFKRKTICTVKTARKLIPGEMSYSLPKLTKSLGIKHSNQHRALGDTEATTVLFEKLLKINPEMGGEEAVTLPDGISYKQISALPKETGLYYFLNAKKDFIYVGKSLDLHKRILQHLNNYSTSKSVEMMNQIADIKFTVTGSELAALLLESDEIKKLKPLYNKVQRRSVFNYALFENIDENGYRNFEVVKVDGERVPITTFQSLNNGKEYLIQLVEKFDLCQKLCGLDKTNGACSEYQSQKCNGACVGDESSEDYNKKFTLAVDNLKFNHKNFFILEQGPELGTKSVIHIKNGIYQGLGIIEDNRVGVINELHECIELMKNNRDTQNIIKSYLKSNKYDLIIY